MIDYKSLMWIKDGSLIKTIIMSALLILVDAFWLNQYIITIIVTIGIVIVLFQINFFNKYPTVHSQILKNVGVYTCAIIFVFILNALNNRIAHSRAELLIDDINLFYTANKRYPKELSEMIPHYIKNIPRAKYTIMASKFIYGFNEQGVYLEYANAYPFGRKIFYFHKAAWVNTG